MRTETALYVLLEILLVNIAVAQSDSKCLTNITDRDYTSCKQGYFCYCEVDGFMKRYGGNNIICGDNDKLKLMNFNAFKLKDNANDARCKYFNSLRYKIKEDTGCLSQDYKDDIVYGFLTALSGKTARQVKNQASTQRINDPWRFNKYKRILLDIQCEAESKEKLDMCQSGSRVFSDNSNVSLYFNPMTFKKDGNQTGCYCYFKTFNTTRNIIVRALDIRIHHRTKLLLDFVTLDPDRIYWWQSGVLRNELAVLKFTNFNPQDVVWMDIYGKNMNITCDTKELVVEGLVTSTPQKFAESSSGGMGMVLIIVIVISAIVFIVILAAVVKYVRSRATSASKSGEYDVDDPDASENFISSTYERGDDPPSPHDSVVTYSKVDNKTAVKSQPRKFRKGGQSDECRLYELDSETDQDDNDPVLHSEHKFSHDAIVHSQPHDINKPPHVDDNSSIYNHFHDHPDVVPPSTTSNIYDTTGRGIYSSFQSHRQHSKPENPYDVA